MQHEWTRSSRLSYLEQWPIGILLRHLKGEALHHGLLHLQQRAARHTYIFHILFVFTPPMMAEEATICCKVAFTSALVAQGLINGFSDKAM